MGEEERQFRAEEREGLRLIIQQWNSNRLDLFEISEPDENLVFTGVMRFYFQDCGQKVATKCIRVSSTATTRHVIETLIEKFRPDMRMLSIPEYTLYEIHENGEERRLAEDEKPLLVQLNWNKDDREGRFLLRRMDFNGKKLRTLPPVLASSQRIEPTVEENFTRKSRLSRRERKELLKQEKLRRTKRDHENDPSVAETLYTELPETSFTRSISNPEAVMRRRRAQKLEKKLQQFRSKDGGPDTGGTLKIYGESLCQDVPYKTLLLSVRDTAAMVVKEMLEKYGLIKEDYTAYCLVQCIVTAEETVDGYQGVIVPQKEYILDDDECPLAILMNHPPSRGSIMFQVRRRPADHSQRRRKKKPLKGTGERGGPNHHQPPHRHHVDSDELLPFLVELGPDYGDFGGKGRQHKLHLNVTEVGSDRCTHTGGQYLQLFGPHIQSRHCVIAHTDGIVTVTPCSRDAETYVDFHRIFETTILQHGSVVRFGRNHDFRFIDPQLDDRLRHHLMTQSNQFADRTSSIAGSQTCIARPPGRSSSEMQLRSPQADESWNNYERYGPAKDPILPAVLEFREDIEDAFLHTISTQLDPTDVQFKLAPTYTLYMAARFRASTHYRPELAPTERAQKLTVMLSKVTHIVHDVIEVKQRDPTALAFWMANASELLHFLKQDRHICGYSLDAQDILAEAVQFAFRKLVEYMQLELSSAMPLFLEDRDDCDEEEGCTAHILSLLTNTMALLRRCRVNAALTIQLFSQLFHYVNMWVFNKVVTENCPNYCTRIWGERIKERLARIELWAEKQGLELAADCHLAKLSQAALLLISTKNSPDDVATLSSTCFKLNSLQLSEILQKYDTEPGESHIPNELIESVIAVAETTADGLAREDGREIRLEEESDLQLPFLLPEDGYSCDIVRGVPSGLAEFLEPLQMAHLCRMTPQPTSSGYWTIYMQNQDISRLPIGPRSPSAMSNRSISIPRGEPEVHTIQLHKSNSGMGLSIVATKGENQDQLGIYIKSVVPGGAAHQDGRLQAGDQLLSVDGKSLVGISQEEAAQYMVGTGPIVSLEVARQGALYHGLAPLLSQPSPQDARGIQDTSILHNIPSNPEFPKQPTHHQPHYPHPQNLKPPQARMQPSKSVPSLHTNDANLSYKASGPLNTSYSRTSSSTSLSQSHCPQRSRSTQNLNEGGPLTLIGRHPSSPSLVNDEDRFYQNVSFHQGPQDPRKGSQRGGRPPIFEGNISSTQHEHRPDVRPVSAFLQREEMTARDNMHRPTSQQNIRPDPKFATVIPDDPRRRTERTGPIAFPMVNQISQSGTNPLKSQNLRVNLKYPVNFPGSQNPGSPRGTLPSQLSPRGGYPHSPSMVANAPHAFSPQMNPQFINPHNQNTAIKHAPPPTAPKPFRDSGNFGPDAPEKPSRQFGFDIGSSGPPRPPPPEDGYRESPPPPPPPASTHPLLQPNGSVLESNSVSAKSLLAKGVKGPWDRDEKEQYELRKREAARRWRDEQISALESMERKTLQEEEMMNTLKLEKEFQRRAEEAQRLEDDEDDDDDDDEDDHREEVKYDKREGNWSQLVSSPSVPHIEDERNEEIPSNKVDEIKRKQEELEAAREAEELLLREAQRRQDEEMRRQQHQQQHQYRASQRLDSLLGSPIKDSQASHVASPSPPDRGSSYSVIQQSYDPIIGARSRPGDSGTVKKVQFSEPFSPSEAYTYDNNANQEKIREDPNSFLDEAEMLLNYTSPNRSNENTPGVIGAQEVYRDPRQRRLLEQAQKAAATRNSGQEKLTFREKMKMFAMETEEGSTPKDKLKHSKAQREIEHSS